MSQILGFSFQAWLCVLNVCPFKYVIKPKHKAHGGWVHWVKGIHSEGHNLFLKKTEHSGNKWP